MFSTEIVSKESVDPSEDQCDDKIFKGLESLSLERADEVPSERQKASVSTGAADHCWENLCKQPKFRRDMYFSACTSCDITELKRLFTRYDDNFIHAKDDHGSGITIAAPEENGLHVIEWLLGKGADLYIANAYGRNALMEAALWGRYDTVHFLVEKGISLTDNDGAGRKALDLVSDDKRNSAERRLRAGNIYRERPDADEKRLRIAALLRRQMGLSDDAKNAQTNIGTVPGHFLKERDGSVAFYERVAVYDVPNGQQLKAFAQLDRGPRYPTVSAMSGYSHPDWPNVINNSQWTAEAFKICQLVGHKTSQSFASHVEKQLIAYYLRRHFAGVNQADGDNVTAALFPLKPSATITMNKQGMRSDCQSFLARVRDIFRDVQIEVPSPDIPAKDSHTWRRP